MLGMLRKKQWPLYAFLGLAVFMAGCKKKVEPQLPIVIVEKPVKRMFRFTESMSEQLKQRVLWKYMLVWKVISRI